MKNVNLKIFALAILGGLIYSVFDSLWDKYFLFPRLSFWTIMLYDGPIHNSFTRPFILILFFVLFTSNYFYLSKIKQSESHYHQLIENVNDAVFIRPSVSFDADEKCVEVNEAACKMLGYTRAELLRLSPRKLIDPERAAEVQYMMEKLKAEGHALFETVFLKKDRSKVPVEINAHVLHFKGNPVCLALARDISAQLANEQALQEAKQQLFSVTDRLIRIQEEERGRMSKELHDELGQDLMFLRLQIRSIQSRLPSELTGLRGECESLLGHLEDTADNVRRLAQDLKPWGLEDMGFSLAARHLIRACCELYGIDKCDLEMDEVDELFWPEAHLNLYRILQESLTNIGKHAEASELSVIIKQQAKQVFIKIQDNGKGYDQLKSSQGLGLTTLKERSRLLGGHLIIRSHPGKGTKIILIIPLVNMAWPSGGKHDGTVSNSVG